MEELKPTKKSPLATLTNAELAIEKIMVMAKVRLKHLERHRTTCPDTKELLHRIEPIDNWLVRRMESYIEANPAYWWFSHVKGAGRELMSKLIGEIEGFGRYYDVGDPEIPPYVKREPEEYIILDEDGNEIVKKGIWVEGIERLTTPSKLRAYAGKAPGRKPQKGAKLTYNARLKMLTHRLEKSFMQARGSFYTFYGGYKDYLEDRVTTKDGKKVMPTPKARYCPQCDKEVEVKRARYCPDCGGQLSQKTEPPGIIYKGHVHQMAQHRMGQLFLDLLWHVWRESLGLPVREPYPVEKQEHTSIIRPEDMMDKSCGKKDCPICHGKDFERRQNESY